MVCSQSIANDSLEPYAYNWRRKYLSNKQGNSQNASHATLSIVHNEVHINYVIYTDPVTRAGQV